MGPLTVEVPEVGDDALYFGLQGGSHVFAIAAARGLDEGGQFSLVLSDAETSSVLGRLTYGVGRLVQDPTDPCRLSAPADELRISSELDPAYRAVTLRAVATRSTGETVSETSEACLVPSGGDPARCGARMSSMRMTQDGRELFAGDVLYIEPADTRWTAEIEVSADPPFEGRIDVNLDSTSESFPATFEDGVATAAITFFGDTYPLSLTVTAYLEDEPVGTLERAGLLPIPSCIDPMDDNPCITYWDTFFVGAAEARITPGTVGPASLFETADLWVDDRGILEGDVMRVLACDEGAPMELPVTLAETTLDYLSAGVPFPTETGTHICEVALIQEGRTITRQTLSYEVSAE